ncbi:CRISPR-associated endonuclease Cas2 [Helcococcus sueciensis]|uniref:CRISPR-associated endonuclease Cas2 n=1 Tax=Helcococcus sueciensis TaxID=241555 RepID=UPI001F08E1E4|nr:CRISPR-associated endonuclease Cas2 [Helcococcus sueciensis]
MSYRFMRTIVFFDLPTITLEDKKQYRDFRKFLLSEGFIMMQESVYCKLSLNQTNVRTVKERIEKRKPKSGIVQILTITEKQFQSMEYIVGEKQTNIIDSDRSLVIL